MVQIPHTVTLEYVYQACSGLRTNVRARTYTHLSFAEIFNWSYLLSRMFCVLRVVFTFTVTKQIKSATNRHYNNSLLPSSFVTLLVGCFRKYRPTFFLKVGNGDF